ncbi:MAG: hydrolase [Bacteroidetes bacterium]|nr:hydrolase [Bacteroidota bacterium]
MRVFKTTLAILFSIAFFSCSKISPVAEPSQKETAQSLDNSLQSRATTTTSAIAANENFESGTKTSYTTANVTLATGVWNLNDALLGNSSSDRKNGTQSARVRNSGKLTMQFDIATGASAVSIAHALYGTDAACTWQLWYSTNGGSSYTQAGATITTNSTSLTTSVFTLSITGSVRFEIRKTDGSTNRINFDDITITDNTGGSGGGGTGVKKFLFDASQGETAGNADWVIDEDNSNPQRIPTPLQTTITSGTSSNYWTGALSSWGIALVKSGHTVETLPTTGSITYGNTSNTQDLSKYDVFVIDEPNIRFTTAEKTAILNFVQNGGGLFMVADHTISDRNNDGWDSPDIWNDLMNNNGTINNPFGFTVDLTDISGISTNVLTGNVTNSILHGSQGNVGKIEFNNGATLTLNPVANASVQGLIWQSGFTQNNTHVLSASSQYGTGRVYMVTDSSPMDDGTGAPNNTLFASWALYSHTALFMNASLWLARLQ